MKNSIQVNVSIKAENPYTLMIYIPDLGLVSKEPHIFHFLISD